MSVYTRIDRGELVAFLRRFDSGELVDYAGIRAGIENTNYFVTTTGGEYVLTIFENHAPDELGYYLDLMAHLAEAGIPTPHPLGDRGGRYLQTLKGKPAALVDRLPGASVEAPGVAHCREIGDWLARLHLAGADFPGHRDNDRGPRWWHAAARRLAGHLGDDEQRLLDDELAFQDAHRRDRLPRGVVHADLFRDNALFEGERLTGIIDLYYACNDAWLFDLAVTVNDWCSRDDGTLDPALTDALLAAYRARRPLEGAEREDWPVMLRAAALRFWLSRLQDLHFPKEGEMTHIKDPGIFCAILEDRRATAEPLGVEASV